MSTLSIYKNFESKILNLTTTYDFCGDIYDLSIPESLQDDPSVAIIVAEIEKLNEKSKLMDIEIEINNQKILAELSLIVESIQEESLFVFYFGDIYQYEYLFNAIDIPLIVNIAGENHYFYQCLIFDNPENVKSKLLCLNPNILIEYKEVKLKNILEKLLVKFS